MSDAARRQPNASAVLVLLLLAYILNYLDRQMLGVLAAPIKADLHLTDTQFGAIGGLAFALLYSVLGVPLAFLADRTSRSAVVAASLAVWSGFTALCGTASGFGQLFLYRLGVGIGEAGGVAPSYALIADYFPAERQARALGIFFLGIPTGLALGNLAGAYIARAVDWRAAFLVMGAAGIILAPILRFVVRDMPRPSRATSRAPLSSVFPILARKPAFWLLSFAASSSSLVGYGLALWTPSVLMRSFGLDLVSMAKFHASYLFLSGVGGVFGGGWLADRLGSKDRAWYARLPALAWVITVPSLVFGFLAPSLWIAWPLLLIGNGLNILWLAPVSTSIQHLVPRPMRATASGCYLFILNIIGLGFGPLLMGRLSDALKATYGVNALRDAAIVCTGFYLVAALIILMSARSLRAGWVADDDN